MGKALTQAESRQGLLDFDDGQLMWDSLHELVEETFGQRTDCCEKTTELFLALLVEEGINLCFEDLIDEEIEFDLTRDGQHSDVKVKL
jgi:hypothetical protein